MEQLVAGTISGEGWKTLYMGLEDKREDLKKLYKEDMAEFFLELHNFLGIDIAESVEEREVLNGLASVVEEFAFDTKNRILCLANEYGIAAEENGFRQGFKTAMRLNASGKEGVLCYEQHRRKDIS